MGELLPEVAMATPGKKSPFLAQHPAPYTAACNGQIINISGKGKTNIIVFKCVLLIKLIAMQEKKCIQHTLQFIVCTFS